MYNRISGSWLKHWDFMLLDMIFLQLSYIFAYVIRNGFTNLYAIEVYLNIGIIICLIDICAAFFLENYRGIMRRGYFMEFKAVVKQVCSVCLFVILYLFLRKNSEEFSRMSFVIFAVTAILVLYTERILWKRYLLKDRKVRYAQTALLILTSSDIAEKVIQTVKQNSYNEVKIVGIVLVDRSDMAGKRIYGENVVCSEEGLFDYIQTEWVDGLLVNVSDRNQISGELEAQCIKMGVTVYIKIDGLGGEIYNQRIEKIAGYVAITAGISAASPGGLLIKRLMDIAGGLIGLAITAVVFIFVAPIIYASSPGPVFFTQTRIGRNGRKFKMYKFRSMYSNAEEQKKNLMSHNQMKGNMFKMDNDPRIIGSGPDGRKRGVGWFIRKTSLDELPQFWNVLKGDMSLVGTRPPTVDEWIKYEHHHRGRLAMKPGLTGMWQVSGRSKITDFEEIVKMDMEYIQNWNVGVDIKILLKTVSVVLKGDGSG